MSNVLPTFVMGYGFYVCDNVIESEGRGFDRTHESQPHVTQVACWASSLMLSAAQSTNTRADGTCGGGPCVMHSRRSRTDGGARRCK